MLLDSNIIIYAAQPKAADLRAFIAEHSPAVSAISVVEVLGYHKITAEEREDFEAFFQASLVLAVSDTVVESAVKLRQQRKTSLGDSLVAATALVHDRTLVTRNTDDFKWVPDLKLPNPFASDNPS